MPIALPDRYHLEVRIGRDEDVEEWLATDLDLDRPVMVRVLGPESSPDRRRLFLDAVRRASTVSDPHLAAVYAADSSPDGAYLVGEWAGGVTIQDRMAAGELLAVDEFLPNAAGLAEALARLHAAGIVHGAIDPGAIYFSFAHPAKLGEFGRIPRYDTPAEDVRALAETLERSVTGEIHRGAAPSQVLDGLSPAVDQALQAAREGMVDAAGLAEALTAAPSPGARVDRPGWSWRWLVPAGLLVFLAVALAAFGVLFSANLDSPLLFPAAPATAPTPTTPSSTAPVVPTVPPAEPVVVTAIATHDPFGDGQEHDSLVGAVADGDAETRWRTERYFSPLPSLKEGVGVAITVEGLPSQLEAAISSGAEYALWWSSDLPEDFSAWERIASGLVSGDALATQLPARRDGVWLLWFTDLPEQDDGYYAWVAEVHFFP